MVACQNRGIFRSALYNSLPHCTCPPWGWGSREVAGPVCVRIVSSFSYRSLAHCDLQFVVRARSSLCPAFADLAHGSLRLARDVSHRRNRLACIRGTLVCLSTALRCVPDVPPAATFFLRFVARTAKTANISGWGSSILAASVRTAWGTAWFSGVVYKPRGFMCTWLPGYLEQARHSSISEAGPTPRRPAALAAGFLGAPSQVSYPIAEGAPQYAAAAAWENSDHLGIDCSGEFHCCCSLRWQRLHCRRPHGVRPIRSECLSGSCLAGRRPAVSLRRPTQSPKCPIWLQNVVGSIGALAPFVNWRTCSYTRS